MKSCYMECPYCSSASSAKANFVLPLISTRGGGMKRAAEH